MPANDDRPCPCCNRLLSDRQIHRHLIRFRRQLIQNLAPPDDHANPAFDNDDPAPNGAVPAPNDLDIAVELDGGDEMDENEDEGERGDEEGQGKQMLLRPSTNYKLT